MQFIQGLGLDEVLEELKKLQLRQRPAPGSTLDRWAQPAPVAHRKSRPSQVARSLLTGEFRQDE